MATASKNRISIAPDPAIGEIRYLLRGVGWEGYESLLEWLGDDAPRMTCWDGDIEFMSPLFEHGKYDALIGYMIDQIVDQFDLTVETFTALTLRKGSVRGGLEPDGSFYFTNAHRVRAGDRIDLDIDPPPD